MAEMVNFYFTSLKRLGLERHVLLISDTEFCHYLLAKGYPCHIDAMSFPELRRRNFDLTFDIMIKAGLSVGIPNRFLLKTC